MQIGDVAQIKLGGKWGDVDIMLNVFHAFNLEADLDLLALIMKLVGELTSQVAALHYSETVLQSIEAVNIFDKSEQAELWLGIPGSRAGIAEQFPSQVAITTRYVHDNPAIRYGYKRWWNPSEIDLNDGILTAARLGTYENVSWAPMLDMLPQAQYVIVKRIRKPGGPPYEYRLPLEVGELDYGVVSDFDINMRAASQNSRKCPPI